MAVTPLFDDQLIIDGNDTVKLIPPRTPENLALTVTACRFPITQQEVSRSDGVYLYTDSVWTLSTTDTPNQTVQPRWVLKPDDGITHTILNVAFSPIASFWRVVTRDLSFNNSLFEFMEVWRPLRVRTDDAGRQIKDFSFYARLKCRVQPMDKPKIKQFESDTLDVSYEIPIEYDPGILLSDQIRLEDHRILEIEGLRTPEEINMLPVVEACFRGGKWE